jgi:hypothetical protein
VKGEDLIVRFLLGFISLILLIPLQLEAGDLAQLELVRQPQEPRIDPRLSAALASKGPQERVKAWVFFTDKGIFDEGSYRAALRTRADKLSPRVRARRLKVRSQKDLVDFADLPVYQTYVDEVMDTGVKLRTTSRWLNAVSIHGSGEEIDNLAELPFVSHIRQVAGGRRDEMEFQEVEKGYSLPKGTQQIDYGPSFAQLDLITVPQVHQWLEQNEMGDPGEDILICLLDTGFDLAHESLQHVDVIDQWDFINGDSVVVDEAGDPPGQDSHGTSVLSVVGGYRPGQLIGPAYGAAFLLAKTEDISGEQPIEEDYWVAGVEWAEGLGTQVASSSLGYLNWYTYSDMDGNTAVTTVAADLAVSRGVVIVTAAGNEADDPWLYIIAPADGNEVIAVGAVDTSGTRAEFSSIGPTYDGRIKPDVMACGRGTYVASALDTAGYYRGFGTSLSTPQVAGVAALLLQADTSLTPTEVKDALRLTANRTWSPNNYYGWGLVNADAARRGERPQRVRDIDLYSFPNPFSQSATVMFRVTQPSRATVTIFTPAGELVRKLSQYCDAEGWCQVQWDGRNRSGQEVADGIYLYQVDAGGQAFQGKMVRLRLE